jgi:hypothetical protein
MIHHAYDLHSQPSVGFATIATKTLRSLRSSARIKKGENY